MLSTEPSSYKYVPKMSCTSLRDLLSSINHVLQSSCAYICRAAMVVFFRFISFCFFIMSFFRSFVLSFFRSVVLSINLAGKTSICFLSIRELHKTCMNRKPCSSSCILIHRGRGGHSARPCLKPKSSMAQTCICDALIICRFRDSADRGCWQRHSTSNYKESA